MIQIKNAAELEKMRKACAISAAALKAGGEAIEPGITTAEIDKIIYDFIVRHGARPNFLHLYGFPATACISVNDTVIHGIPNKQQQIRPGDIVSIDTGCKIDINDDGTVFIASVDAASAAEAKRIIDGIVKDIEVGDVYLGTVVGIKEFGAFINLKPGTDGLLHISRIANKRVEKVEDVLQMGEQVLVRVIDVDPKSGKISLTRKDLLPADQK